MWKAFFQTLSYASWIRINVSSLMTSQLLFGRVYMILWLYMSSCLLLVETRVSSYSSKNVLNKRHWQMLNKNESTRVSFNNLQFITWSFCFSVSFWMNWARAGSTPWAPWPPKLILVWSKWMNLRLKMWFSSRFMAFKWGWDCFDPSSQWKSKQSRKIEKSSDTRIENWKKNFKFKRPIFFKISSNFQINS